MKKLFLLFSLVLLFQYNGISQTIPGRIFVGTQDYSGSCPTQGLIRYNILDGKKFTCNGTPGTWISTNEVPPQTFANYQFTGNPNTGIIPCTLGDIGFQTDATPGQNFWGCTSNNTWTQESGGGSSSSAATVTCNATMTLNVAVCSAPYPAVSSYGSASMGYISGYLTVSAANTGAWTLQVGSGAAVSVLTATGGTPAANQVASGTTYAFAYNGTNFIVSQPGQQGPTGPAGTQCNQFLYTNSFTLDSTYNNKCGIFINSQTVTLPSGSTLTPPYVFSGYEAGSGQTLTLNVLANAPSVYGIPVANFTYTPINAGESVGFIAQWDGISWSVRKTQGPTGAAGVNGAQGPAGPSNRAWSYVFSNNGSALTLGQLGGAFVSPIACTLNYWDIDTQINNAPGADTATVKVYKIASGTLSPGSGNSISTSGVSISTGSHVHSTTMSDFTTTTVIQYDILAFYLSAVGGSATQITFTLGCQ